MSRSSQWSLSIFHTIVGLLVEVKSGMKRNELHTVRNKVKLKCHVQDFEHDITDTIQGRREMATARR